MNTGPSPEREAAAEAWALMQSFVGEHSPRHRLRERLGTGLAKGRSKVMALLMLADQPRSLAEIADAQRIDPPYATAIVDQLEGLGLAERSADASDRRRKLVALTPAGVEAATIAQEIIATPPAALTALTADELAQLTAILIRLTSPPG
jgi:DNA-binding MarR family transcriptional regulator